MNKFILTTILCMFSAQHAFADRELDLARRVCIGDIEQLKSFADTNLKNHKTAYNEYVSTLAKIGNDLINRVEQYNSILQGLPEYERPARDRKYAGLIVKFCEEEVNYAEELNKELLTEINKMGKQPKDPAEKKSKSLLDEILDFIVSF